MKDRALWPRSLDAAAGWVVLLFVLATALFALRDADVFWHLAVGRLIVENGELVRKDPFMFTVPGLPWTPNSWLAGLGLYAVHRAASAPGLVALQGVLVGSIFGISLLILRRLRVSLLLASPVVLVGALCAQSRFMLRPHLFEYLLLVVLLFHLITAPRTRGARFFVLPVALQVLWVNVHASFFIGPLVALAFFAGEWLSLRLGKSLGTKTVRAAAGVEWKPATLLVLAMAAASVVSPDPAGFLGAPFDARTRQLLSRYTLEWLSPFDPRARTADFHPYYELSLAFAAAAFLASIKRLKIASLGLVAAFAALSVHAHRFRVEFVLVTLPLALDQLASAPAVASLRRRLAASSPAVRWTPACACGLLALVLMIGERDRVGIDFAEHARFPSGAAAFVRAEKIAHRPFHTIGFGSYFIWTLYGERQVFIDGRNIDARPYEDLIACQTNSAGFNSVVRKYDLDAFILPALEESDPGIRNVHHFLLEAENWTLVHMDHAAYVYVREAKVPPEWLGRHRFDLYHPLTFPSLAVAQDDLGRIAGELERARRMDAAYPRPLLDSARFFGAIGEPDKARGALERVLGLDPGNAEALEMMERLGES